MKSNGFSERQSFKTDITRIPPHVPEIAHEDSSVHSLDSHGSINVSNPVPSYAEQGKQAEDEARKTEQKAAQSAKQSADKASDSVKDTSKAAGNKIDEYEREGQKAYNDVKKEVKKDYNKVKKEAGVQQEKAKKSAKHAERWAEENRNNPVVVGNAVVVTALAGLIGFGAYRKYIAGELNWKVAGTWAGVVGLFAVGDYYVSSWLFKNKYPPKN
ncbi:hypothetical protein AMS68_006854 [Peltaster fructicola]|uniref:Mitochondrial outer membrane protein OM14 C-terminal domain-containing protein n=1 Tax=Peltaster fructicola TaxID=286661 RepID=A0A6H0Y2V8_9PEZI|nr:hypothetical protein AMS68_006854 [Peltaster fructicola]